MGSVKSAECTFRGSPVPITKKLDEFVHIARDEKLSIGLRVKIRRFSETYGELLSLYASPFEIKPSSGPCYLICAGCERELDEKMLAMLGPKSFLSEFGGMRPVNQCPDCGSPDVIIVWAKSKRRSGPRTAVKSSKSGGTKDARNVDDAVLSGFQAVIDSYASKLAEGSVHIRPNIPVIPLTNALASYASGASKEEVMLQFDTTVSGNGKTGIVLTPTIVYGRDFLETWQIPLSEIRTVELKRLSLRVNHGSVGLTRSRTANQALADLLRDLARWSGAPHQ